LDGFRAAGAPSAEEVIHRDKERTMLDHDTDVRHEVADARMAALRRSAEPIAAGTLGRRRPRHAYVAVIACTLVAVLAVAGRASAAGADAAFVPSVDDSGDVVAASAASSFELVFAGGRGPAVWSDLGWRHEGTFTASAPFCSAGTAADVLHEFPFPDLAVRYLTCGDGSGSVSLHVAPFTAEEAFGGIGTWTIVGGTGGYATLRGTGTWGTVPVDGIGDHVTERFRATLAGVVAFDVAAPVVRFERLRVTRRPGARALRVVFSAPDDVVGNAVSYRVTALSGGQVLGERVGTTTSGRTVSLTQVIPLRRAARRATVVVTATDPLGNARRVARVVPLTPTT
jgi:hypothetical protein